MDVSTGHRTLPSLLSTADPELSSLPVHTAAIALGSNLGDRFANIEQALRLLEAPTHLCDAPIVGDNAEVYIVDTSFMYETAPMYVTDQPSFINCACMIKTNIQPQALLTLLKKIESTVGRVPSVRNGPRAVDLDILLYDEEVVDTRSPDDQADLDHLDGHLIIPHPRMREREFVLRPLSDMIPDFQYPQTGESIRSLLAGVVDNQSHDEPPMLKVVPFPRYPLELSSANTIPGFARPVPSTTQYWRFAAETSGKNFRSRKTYIMATLNATPDSFSDGSVHNALPSALSYVDSSVAAGADIIDIGGYSTRPGADYVSPEDEISRVVPIIEAVRHSESPSKDVLFSVDTFRFDVAEAAVLAGANCINDVHAFTGPDYPLNATSAQNFLAMRKVARNLSVPVVLMHSRGDAGSNKDYGQYKGSSISTVLNAIQLELGDKVSAAVRGKGGIRRWNVIVDPGVGFSKTVADNLEILRNASLITKTRKTWNSLAGYPQLIGTSKKSFLGTILAEPDRDGTYQGRKIEAKERGWATAAAVACSVQQGAGVIRVHDVLEMGDVIRVSSALWIS